MFKSKGFTLIELLVVVGILGILAAIAIPNYLNAQVRAKTASAVSDMRTLATGLELFRVDHNDYPEGTDQPGKYPEKIGEFLGALAPGYYTFKTRETSGEKVGADFPGLTTPVAYISSMPTDPFVKQLSGIPTYNYRNAKDRKNGFIITSVGPDADLLSENGKGTTNPNPLSTFSDPNIPSRIGDINERGVIHYIENTHTGIVTIVNAQYGGVRNALNDLSYDPTNGVISDGDIYRLAP